MQEPLIQIGARYVAVRGQHEGTTVKVIGHGDGHVRFMYARKVRRTDSERWHKLDRQAFVHLHRPL